MIDTIATRGWWRVLLVRHRSPERLASREMTWSSRLLTASWCNARAQEVFVPRLLAGPNWVDFEAPSQASHPCCSSVFLFRCGSGCLFCELCPAFFTDAVLLPGSGQHSLGVSTFQTANFAIALRPLVFPISVKLCAYVCVLRGPTLHIVLLCLQHV